MSKKNTTPSKTKILKITTDKSFIFKIRNFCQFVSFLETFTLLTVFAQNYASFTWMWKKNYYFVFAAQYFVQSFSISYHLILSQLLTFLPNFMFLLVVFHFSLFLLKINKKLHLNSKIYFLPSLNSQFHLSPPLPSFPPLPT
ncbi:unnamed protein product [Meganyctiphanes norvegica]|uniref:Transmembrane protein n=1 Tax=Meganyctiphanes norvegica TaxID=48144 RepID=A0AAV2R5Y3_MEGNR